MKRDLVNKIIRFLNSLILVIYRTKCWISFYLYGAEGIGYVIERIPRIYLIPILKSYGCTIGKNCRILAGITFHNLSGKKPLKNLILGDNVYIGRNVLLDLADKIEIMDDSSLGAGCQVWTHVGDYTYNFKDYHERKAQVRIGRGVLCWSMVLISPGVTIGDYTRVAAGSIVVRDLESKMFYGGVPARLIRERDID
ncbi:MAG: hypothetical protein AB9834_16425 [Lentimicrobium sp.]